MLDTVNMAEQLSGDYRETFEWVDIYCNPLQIDEKIKDERLMELYDLLVEAEHNGKPAEKIVGRDLELFCKNFFAEDARKYRLKDFLNSIYRIAFGFLIISIIDVIWSENRIDIVPFLVGISAGLLLDVIAKYFLQPIALKKKMKPIIYYLIIMGLFLCIVVLVGFVCLTIQYEIAIGSRMLLAVTGSYVVIYLVVRSVMRYRHHGNIRSADWEGKKMVKEFNREVENAGLIVPSAKGLAAQFKRIRKRKQKKGVDYTFAEYAEKVRKAKGINRWVDIGMPIFVALLVLGPSIDIMLDETIWDGLFFMAVMAVVEFFVCRFFCRSGHNLTDLQIKIVDECEEKGIDILEYIGEKETYNEQQ
ncbi:MAG: hypothetical protein UHS49_05510 [Faecalimonas sp.]|nr:hypothetical protein [Faecalimonas sp.]